MTERKQTALKDPKKFSGIFIFAALLAVLISLPMTAALATQVLSDNNTVITLPHCRGTAEFKRVNEKPFLFVSARKCSRMFEDQEKDAAINPGGYALKPDVTSLVTVQSADADHLDSFLVETTPVR